MNEHLNTLVSEDFWEQCEARLKNKGVMQILRELHKHIINTLTQRTDDVTTEPGRMLAYFSAKREIIRINVNLNDLRIYIHPASRALFDPDAKFRVERFNLWDSSFQKKTGKYRGMSVWISDIQYLPGVKEIIDLIPVTPT